MPELPLHLLIFTDVCPLYNTKAAYKRKSRPARDIAAQQVRYRQRHFDHPRVCTCCLHPFISGAREEAYGYKVFGGSNNNYKRGLRFSDAKLKWTAQHFMVKVVNQQSGMF